MSCLDVSAVHDEEGGFVSFFVVNRSENEIEAEFDVAAFGSTSSIADHQVMTHADLKAVNTETNMNNVAPKKADTARLSDGRLSATCAPYSYQMVRIKV